MKDYKKLRTELFFLYLIVTITTVIWTVIIAGSLVWNIYNEHQQIRELAKKEARANFNKDQAFRFWATSHGGVYVPVTDHTPPNPYLSHIPDRDITTSSGKNLTLMNPAYMVRQLMEDYERLYGIKGHITSLKVLNLKNAPDEWERKALEAFERGVIEVFEFTEINGEPYLRLMRPMITERACLKCHVYQGYKEGDIRGGVGVSVPIKPYLTIERAGIKTIILTHGIIWLLGLMIIGFVAWRGKQRVLERRQAEESLRKAYDELERRVEERTAELATSNTLLKEEITVRKQAEEEINKLAKFPNENPNPVLRVTKDGTIIYANNSSLRLLNDWKCQIGQHLPHPLHQYIFAVLDSGLSKDIEVTCGDRIFSLTFAHIVKANYVNVYGLDITERKQAEKALKSSQAQLIQSEKMSAMGTMIAGVAHEMNNPLMGIINFIKYCLKKTSSDDKRFTILQDAERATKQCIGIVDNLLTFVHMEKEGEEEFQKGSCAKILEQVFKLLTYRIIKEQVSVIKHYAEGVPYIWMRVNSMQQVFLNIITNALDALKENEKKEIHIDIHRESEFVLITIADTGMGIAPENLDKIFDPFFTTKPPGKGTGLGLSISQSIVKIHAGKIICKSKPGQGAKFEILLPIEMKKRRR